MEPFRSVGVQLQECPARLILPIFVPRTALLLDGNSSADCQLSHSRWKIGMLVIHNEAKNAPARATPEAVEGLPARADDEGRRFLPMKGAERLEIHSRPFQWKIGGDYFGDIVRGSNLLDRFRRDRSHARLIIFASFGFGSDVKLTQCEVISKL